MLMSLPIINVRGSDKLESLSYFDHCARFTLFAIMYSSFVVVIIVVVVLMFLLQLDANSAKQ